MRKAALRADLRANRSDVEKLFDYGGRAHAARISLEEIPNASGNMAEKRERHVLERQFM
jgi:hypothetical protein